MNGRNLAITIALALFAAALWWLSSGEDVARVEPSGSDARPAHASANDEGREPSAPGESGKASRAVPVAKELAPMIRARVVDELGEALSDGSVSLRCLRDDGQVKPIVGGTATLGAEGAFAAIGCDGRVCVELHHATAVRAEPWVVEVGRVETLRAQSFPRLEGEVRAPDGEPVAGARVVAVPGVENEPRAVPPYTATATSTDEDGLFSLARIERPPCDPCTEAQGRCADDDEVIVWSRVRITARAPGYRVTEVVIDPDEEGPVTIDLAPPMAPIEGRVLGDVPVGLSIMARSDERPYEVHSGDVTETGEFEIRGVGPGPYTLRAIHGGQERGRAAGASSGGRVELTLTPPAAHSGG